MGNEQELVEDVDTESLVKLVEFLIKVKPQAPTPYTMRYLG